MKKEKFAVLCTLIMMMCLSGCGQPEKQAEKTEHLVVYIWDNRMLKDIVPYIKKQIPDGEIEFIVGNNNVDLYNYLDEHGDLPDIITTRRFSERDAKELQPSLLDLGAYDIVSEYYPYALQYYADSEETVKWLPVCGIPETIIANRTLFERYGIKIPENYGEFAQACEKFHEVGIKPYGSELAMDWAAHSLIQGAAIDQFSSIDGIEWRSQMEAASGEAVFEDALWNQIFAETAQFMKDTYLTDEDLECDLTTARDRFANGETAMFRGTPSVMEYLSSHMEDERIRLPYFSQTSDESWIYTYPSFNVALNSELENQEEKLELAMRVLDCFLSEEGQRLVADGKGMISYSANAESDFNGMVGVEDQIEKNAFYIRYASNGTFSASLEAVRGLLSGEMDEVQAYEKFKQEIYGSQEENVELADLKKQYPIALNRRGGREAASSILTTVRRRKESDLAVSSYYYYTSSIYAGSCTEAELNRMVAHNDEAFLYTLRLSGAQIENLIAQYLLGGEDEFQVTDKYELPIASGMKLFLRAEPDQFLLEKIEIAGKPIEKEERYEIVLTDEMIELLRKLYPAQAFEDEEKTKLADEWVAAVESGEQPCEPEDYIEIIQKKDRQG